MSEYAEDIRSTAINLADTLILEREVSGQSPDYTKWAYMMCAQALMARDERAAKIAEETPLVELTNTSAPGDPIHHRYMFEVAASAQRSNIANAIRTQQEK